MHLIALALVAWSSAQTPQPVVERPPAPHARRVEQPAAPPLPPHERLWFEDAIDHILKGN